MNSIGKIILSLTYCTLAELTFQKAINCFSLHRLLAFYYGLSAGQMFSILSGKEIMAAVSLHLSILSVQP